MVGTCDYCGQYCSEVGLDAAESFELKSGWIPTSAIERHRKWSQRRYECHPDDEGHRGPLHDSQGRRLDRCRHCYSPTHESGWSDWSTTLDHSRCVDCWVGVAGAQALRKTARIRPGRSGDSSWTDAELEHDPLEAVLSTAPADRTRAEVAIRAYLGNSRLRVRWVPSPGALARELQTAINAAGPALDFDHDFPEPWSVWSLAPEAVRNLVDDLTWGRGGERVAAVARAVTRQEGTPGDAVGLASILADAGQFDLRGLSPVGEATATQDELVADGGFLRMLDELRQSAGSVLLFRGEVLATERPFVFEVDGEGRLHSESGPALAWADGLEVWSWHGTDVPDWVILDPERITVELIDGERNAEVRRVMAERFGMERLVRECGGEVVNADDTGRLWRRRVGPEWPAGPTSWTQAMSWGSRPRPRTEHVVMVELLNSTPEPDGSRKTYFLRVPPETRTAREGVAWTFGMSEYEYSPQQET